MDVRHSLCQLVFGWLVRPIHQVLLFREGGGSIWFFAAADQRDESKDKEVWLFHIAKVSARRQLRRADYRGSLRRGRLPKGWLYRSSSRCRTHRRATTENR